MSNPSLRTLLGRPGMLSAPGARDAAGAQPVGQAGYEAVYTNGAATSLAYGYPDVGLLDLGEMAANAGRMARPITVPLIADTGYGSELNVVRTVREHEVRGVAAIHIEDQVAPKRRGHLHGNEVVGRGEFVSKIRAALEARGSREFLVIAGTDARAAPGRDGAVHVTEAACRLTRAGLSGEPHARAVADGLSKPEGLA